VAEPSRKLTEAEVRGELIAPQVRRHAWLNIAGPLSALILGGLAAAFYFQPIKVLRWVQLARVGWSDVTQNDIAINDGLMTYLVTGGYSGMDPVVLVHGLGPNAALVWRDTMPLIAEGHFKVVAPNLMGFASSEHKQIKYTIGYQAGALGQLIDQLKLDHVNLVGDNLGADVALYYAVDHPDKVERLVLVGGGLFGQRGAAQLHKMIPTDLDSMRTAAQESFFGLPTMPDAIYQRMIAELADDLQAQTDMLNSVPADEGHIRSKLGQIFNTLTIIIYSGRNPYYTSAEAEALHAALPGSATVKFKTSGVYPELEHPDDFADSLIFVFKQTEGGQ
jgi:pimeloyl-ACP methyl ester carboxylesterase